MPSPSSSSLSAFLQAFWKFLRPHTIRGTVLGSLAITARSLLEQGAPLASLDWAGLAPRAALGVLALLAGNGFIVGINQIYDVDIDVVNKPFLPVAAGELSPKAAWVLVVGLAIAGIALSWGVFGKEIGILYAFGLTLGAVYSVPPFRLKTKPVPAFLIIATVRGFLLNYGVYSAVRAALGLQFIWSPAMVRNSLLKFFFFSFRGRSQEVDEKRIQINSLLFSPLPQLHLSLSYPNRFHKNNTRPSSPRSSRPLPSPLPSPRIWPMSRGTAPSASAPLRLAWASRTSPLWEPACSWRTTPER